MSIDSLDCDILTYLLSFLPNIQLFKIESVNKKWQKCVRKLINRRINEFTATDLRLGKLRCSSIDDQSTDKIKNYLSRCQSVKYLNFMHCKICSSKHNNLLEIAKLCPKLNGINITSSRIELTDNQWDEFVKFIGPKLTECNCAVFPKNQHNLKLIKKLFNQFRMIETVEFDTPTPEWATELFGHLNSCENLNKLIWNKILSYCPIVTNQIANVINRIKYLEINFKDFTYLNCKMDNLIDLKFILSYNGIDQFNQMDSIEFPNLKRLSIDLKMSSYQFNAISKLEFPNLEFACIYYTINTMSCSPDFGNVFDVEALHDDQQIFQLLKNVNQLQCFNLPLTDQIFTFNKLTEIKLICNEMKPDDKLKSIDIINKHKSLKEIIIDENFIMKL